jgi:integral membrane protein
MVSALRVVGILEGLSFLVLLFVAMPAKYLFASPGLVRVVGMGHGVLFVTFGVLLAQAHFARDWSVRDSARLFGATLVPFGFLLVDRWLRNEIDRSEAGASP